MHHTVAFRASVAASTLAEVAAIADEIIAVTNNRFFPPRDVPLLAAWAGSADLQRARISTPKTRQVSIPLIAPIDQAALPPDLPAVMDLRRNPYVLFKEEEIAVEAFQNNVAAQIVSAVFWLLYEPDMGTRTPQPMPMGDMHTIRATSTTAVTAGAWTSVALTYDQQLPVGEYAIIGATHDSTTGIAFRLIVDMQYPRPGGLSRATRGLDPWMGQLMGGLGTWGRFRTVSLPRLQVFATAADAAHELWLQVVRVG